MRAVAPDGGGDGCTASGCPLPSQGLVAALQAPIRAVPASAAQGPVLMRHSDTCCLVVCDVRVRARACVCTGVVCAGASVLILNEHGTEAAPVFWGRQILGLSLAYAQKPFRK